MEYSGNLKAEKIIKSKRKRETQELYLSSFSKEDKMPFWMMVAMSYLPNTDFLSYYDGDRLCGFVYMATMGKVSFVMFFAVSENLRSQGYGSRILREIQARYPNNKIIISIELCDQSANDIAHRLRRKKFYKNNGYVETGYFIKLGGKEQEIIIKNGTFNKREFTIFFMLYSCFTNIPRIWRANG